MIILVLTLFVVLFSQPALAGEQLWDFKNHGQIDDWEIINGTWEIDDGVLKETSGAESGMHAFVGDVAWENYTVEAKIRVDNGKYSGLAFRGQDDYEYYVFYVELNPDPGDLAFFKHIPSDPVPGDPGARERPEPNKTDIGGRNDLVPGEWYHMKIVVEENNFVVFINDEEVVPESTDNLGNEYIAGKVGAWTWQTQASFDDFKVYGPDIQGAAVDSQDKLATAWGKLKLN